MVKPDLLPEDQAVREAVLDTRQSFIVQAPAGSGKTELLMRRFLALLAQVQRPEEILALTFTNKAAAEMRERVLKALMAAAQGLPLEKPQDAVPRRLAKAALAQDAKQNWQLLKNSSRLRIETIDAFSASLVQQLPILSKMGSETRINDRTDYAAVVARATAAFAREEPQAMQTILTFWKNDPQNLQDTLVHLLKKRDQWRRFLAKALQQKSAAAKSLCDALSDDRQALRAQLLADFPEDLLRDFIKFFPLPTADAANWDAWLGHLLTEKNNWRQKLSDDYSEAQKKCIKQTIADLKSHGVDSGKFGKLRHLPSARLSAEQCALLQALLQLLQWTDAELVAHFAARGESDFSEVAAAAVRALSDPQDAEAPSDILLKLDQRLSHLLVDEFQDTSYSQYQLLEKLMSGWQPEDGRTLFLVGDPMQSIYGFREAEVSLFIKVFEDQAFATRSLRACVLSENFRSAPNLVQWYNAVFQGIFPTHSDPDSGSVAFRKATVTTRHDTPENKPVTWHFCEKAQEMTVLIALLQQELAATPCAAAETASMAEGQEKNGNKKNIAVLYPKRSQVKAILAKWPQAAPRFQGVELQALAERPVVRDAQAFCAAWLEPTDLLSGLAVCHSPLVGFTLADLQLLREAEEAPFCFVAARAAALTPEKKQRFEQLCQQYAEAQALRQRQPVVAWLEAAWLKAGGLAAIADRQAQSEVLRFWQVLRERFGQAVQLRLEEISAALEGLYADTQSDSQVQVMTIHKAKGLEFDTVILLGLNNTKSDTSNKAAALLYWQEWFFADRPLFLLTTDSKAHPDALLKLLKEREKDKSDQEKLRLLYVAVTRAKMRLHLLVAAETTETGEKKFNKNSFLHDLFFDHPAFAEKNKKDEPKAPARSDAANYENYNAWPSDLAVTYASALPAQHLPFDWQPPSFPASQIHHADDLKEVTMPLAESDSLLPRQLGRVIHRFFWRLVQDGLQAWPSERLSSEGERIRWWLRQEGVLPTELAAATEQVKQALENVLTDPDGLRLLQPAGDAEWALSFREQSQVRNFIVDRTFVAEGKRFIVDYKTSQPKDNESLADFFAREKNHYQAQLEQYAKILRQYDAQAGKVLPIELALYFPLVVKKPRFYAWPYSIDFSEGE
jgi:ATP-dependent exoDNAse (exonuclease V) beta subunit